ncbi:unnamed protein product [Calypogeia fissa]
MREALPFHLQMVEHFGERAVQAEIELWIGSIAVGMFACYLVYDQMQHYSPIIFGDYYKKLPKAKQVEWDNRAFSTSHAIFCGFAAGYLLLVSDTFHDDRPFGPVAFRSTIFSFFTLGFSTGYFLADLVMIVWLYPSLGGLEIVRFLQAIDWGMVLHHFLSLGSVVLGNYTAHAHYYILMVLFSEISTPFINIRWYLIESGLKNSKAYLYNGVALFLVWLGVRVLMFMYFFYHLYIHYDEIRDLYAPGFYFMFTAPPGLALMNLFWFYKILLGVVKTISRSGKRE